MSTPRRRVTRAGRARAERASPPRGEARGRSRAPAAAARCRAAAGRGAAASSEQVADPARREPARALAVQPALLAADEHAAQTQRDEEQPARAFRVRVAAVLAKEAQLAAQVLDEQQ